MLKLFRKLIIFIQRLREKWFRWRWLPKKYRNVTIEECERIRENFLAELERRSPMSPEEIQEFVDEYRDEYTLISVDYRHALRSSSCQRIDPEEIKRKSL